MSMFMFVRIRESFRETQYELSRLKTMFLFTMPLFQIIIGTCGALFQWINNDDETYWDLAYACVVILIIYCWIITFMFSHRLLAIAVSLRLSKFYVFDHDSYHRSSVRSISGQVSNGYYTTYNSTDNIGNNINNNNKNTKQNSIQFSSNQSELLDIIARQTTIVIVESSVFLLEIMFRVVWQIFFPNCDYTDYASPKIAWCIWSFSFDVTLLIVNLCMWYSFIFAAKEYNTCCFKCHKMVLYCTHKVAKQKIKYDIHQRKKQTGDLHRKLELGVYSAIH